MDLFKYRNKSEIPLTPTMPLSLKLESHHFILIIVVYRIYSSLEEIED